VIETKCGPIEYAVQGQGTPILSLHGAMGGVGQGLMLARIVDPARFQVISMSRPGYRRTPMTSKKSFEMQADACAALLDALNIEKAAVLGISAGGPPAIQFALRYPERCTALILLSAAGPGILSNLGSANLARMFDWSLSSEFVLWLLFKMPFRWMLRAEGHRPEWLADPGTMSLIKDLIADGLPLAGWKAGTLNDIGHAQTMKDWPLDAIEAPTLILQGERDTAIKLSAARFHAEHIRNAKLIVYEGATHFAVATHYREIGKAIMEFLSGRE